MLVYDMMFMMMVMMVMRVFRSRLKMGVDIMYHKTIVSKVACTLASCIKYQLYSIVVSTDTCKGWRGWRECRWEKSYFATPSPAVQLMYACSEIQVMFCFSCSDFNGQ